MKNARLTVEIDREIDGRWIADVPDLPGCMAYGGTREAAVSAVTDLARRILADRGEHVEIVAPPPLTALLDALADLDEQALDDVYNIQRCDAPLDDAVFAWRDAGCPRAEECDCDGLAEESLEACDILGIDTSDDYDYLGTLRAKVAEIQEFRGDRALNVKLLDTMAAIRAMLAPILGVAVDAMPAEEMAERVAGPSAYRDVVAERAKQRAKWGDAHDDDHDPGDLATAAAHMVTGQWCFNSWPAELRRKHRNRRDQLVIAAALLLAEIERMDRAVTVTP